MTDAVLSSFFAGERASPQQVSVPLTVLHVVCVPFRCSQIHLGFTSKFVRTCLHIRNVVECNVFSVTDRPDYTAHICFVLSFVSLIHL